MLFIQNAVAEDKQLPVCAIERARYMQIINQRWQTFKLARRRLHHASLLPHDFLFRKAKTRLVRGRQPIPLETMTSPRAMLVVVVMLALILTIALGCVRYVL